MTDEPTTIDRLVTLSVELFRTTKKRKDAEDKYAVIAETIPEYKALESADEEFSEAMVKTIKFRQEYDVKPPSIDDQRAALERVRDELGDEFKDQMDEAEKRLDDYEASLSEKSEVEEAADEHQSIDASLN